MTKRCYLNFLLTSFYFELEPKPRSNASNSDSSLPSYSEMSLERIPESTLLPKNSASSKSGSEHSIDKTAADK